jgi:hypothetical protein
MLILKEQAQVDEQACVQSEKKFVPFMPSCCQLNTGIIQNLTIGKASIF